MSADQSKSPPWYDFYPERFIAGTVSMDAAERGMYISLMSHQWLMDGLPDDRRTLDRLAGGELTPAVLAKFPLGADGKRRKARLESVRQEQRDRIDKSKARGRKAAEARWSRDASAMHEQCTSNAQAMHEQCINDAYQHPQPNTQHPQPSDIVSASPPHPNPEKAKRQKFQKPTQEEWVTYALSMPEPLTENQALGAWDYYEANGWKVGRNPMVNWQATLRAWSRRRKEHPTASNHSSASPPLGTTGICPPAPETPSHRRMRTACVLCRTSYTGLFRPRSSLLLPVLAADENLILRAIVAGVNRPP